MRYARKGGGEYTLTTMLNDCRMTTPDGRVMEGRAGDVLITRHNPLPRKQWFVEQGEDDELYQELPEG